MSKTQREIMQEFENDIEQSYKEVCEAHNIVYEAKNDTHGKAYQSIIDMIQEDRQNDYGDAEESFGNIAAMWRAYLSRKLGQGVSIDKTDVAVMMALMKVSRFAYQRKHDSVLDMASYADFALKFTENENV